MMRTRLPISRLLPAALLAPLLGALFAVPAAAKAGTSDNPAYTSLMQNVLINALRDPMTVTYPRR